MKNKWGLIIIVVAIILVVVAYKMDWFGLANQNKNTARYISTSSNIFSKLNCPPNCTLTTQTTSTSSNVSEGNVTYTCKCYDGSTTSPLIVQ